MMTEEEAYSWLDSHVPRETMPKLELFADLVKAEAQKQNLISRSTLPSFWARHIVDSAQLATLTDPEGSWIDIGSGGGFPGLVIATIRPAPVVLVEPRSRRAEFLKRTAAALGLSHRVQVLAQSVETVRDLGPFAVVSARAVTSLLELLRICKPVTSPDTTIIAPKGRSAAAELEAACRTWQGDFAMVPSITDPDAGIVIVRRLRPKDV